MAAQRAGSSGVLRIIGGSWRGRKLRFKAAPGLRPTPDRVRETVFNWLSPQIQGAHCLDLFAGSGALGLEALSRGAAHCSFVDAASSSIDSIRAHLELLDCTAADCHRTDAVKWLAASPASTSFDIAFLDPPFGQQLATPTCQELEQNGWLAEGARIYLETGVRDEAVEVPANWELLRDKSAGDVHFRLFVRN